MHHHLFYQESTSYCQSFENPAPVRFTRWVKLNRRLHTWWYHPVNAFKFQPCDNTPPGTQKLIGFPAGTEAAPAAPTPSRHRLQLGLRWSLITFDPPTFVLDQGKHPRQMLSPSPVCSKSKNFTSDSYIPMPPTLPLLLMMEKPVNQRW